MIDTSSLGYLDLQYLEPFKMKCFYSWRMSQTFNEGLAQFKHERCINPAPPLAAAQVLSALEALKQAPPAFAASAQYVKKKKAASKEGPEEVEDQYDEELEQDLDDEEDLDMGVVRKQPKKAKKPKKKANAKAKAKRPAKSHQNKPQPPKTKSNAYGCYEAGKYNEAREKFMAKHMQKMSWRDANILWGTSQEKKNLLKDVPLPELKRRRFVPKGCTDHPFKD